MTWQTSSRVMSIILVRFVFFCVTRKFTPFSSHQSPKFFVILPGIMRIPHCEGFHVLICHPSRIQLKNLVFAFVPFCWWYLNFLFPFRTIFLGPLPKRPCHLNSVSRLSCISQGFGWSSDFHQNFLKCSEVAFNFPWLSRSCVHFCLSKSRCEASSKFSSTVKVVWSPALIIRRSPHAVPTTACCRYRTLASFVMSLLFSKEISSFIMHEVCPRRYGRRVHRG